MTPSGRSNIMRVEVGFSIEVDRQCWAEVYGSSQETSEIRAEVKRYALAQLQQSAAAEDDAILSVVEVREVRG